MTRLTKTLVASLLSAVTSVTAAAGYSAAGAVDAPATAPVSALQADAPPIAHVATTAPSAQFIRSAKSGRWSDPATWQGNRLPGADAEVIIRSGDHVTFDVQTDKPLRYVHVVGSLSFTPDRDTRMDVGLLLVRPGDEEVSPTDAVNVMAHGSAGSPPAILEIGTSERPIDQQHQAVIRLTYIPGMDPDVCPALIDAGGRMDLHGREMIHTWLKLKTTASAGDRNVTVTDPVNDWKVGDRIIVVTTAKPGLFGANQKIISTVRDATETEERLVSAVDGAVITLDRPLGYTHTVNHVGDTEYAGEVANLSRNVVVESADPDGIRGHTMYHHGSQGSISYAEFRHLGKQDHLGRYSLHFHLVGETMRGSSIIGASIWDSANRWLTLHGTDYMVVRDCVGYRSVGHGFFLEDGSETKNVFDHNLAVQAMHGKPLPEQILPTDKNDGAGFWWANSLNTFTRNTAAECDQHGFRFEADSRKDASNSHLIRDGAGGKTAVDVRTLPFIRFEDNEAHSMRRFCLNLGGFAMIAEESDFLTRPDGTRGAINLPTVNIGDANGVGPDSRHAFLVKNFKAWASHWAFHSASPSILVDGLDVYDCNYGLWRCRCDRTEFHNMSMRKMEKFDIFNPWGGNGNFDDDYSKFIKISDDRPPATIVTGVRRSIGGDWVVTGTTEDNGIVNRVTVNGKAATPIGDNFSTWQIVLSGPLEKVTASAVDAAGNEEKTPQIVSVAESVATATH